MRFSAENSADAADSFTLTVTYSAYTESFLLYAYGGKAYAYLYDEDGGAHWSDVSEHVTQDETAAGADGVAYIRLVRFAGDAAEAFARAAAQYREDGAETLFLDLRNNGGGLMSVLERISAYLLRDADSDNEIIQTARYNPAARRGSARTAIILRTTSATVPCTFAANGNSASASEALIGAMYSYGTISYADIFLTKIGDYTAKTYGKGIMQTTYTNGGEAVTLTTAQIYCRTAPASTARASRRTIPMRAAARRRSPSKTMRTTATPALAQMLAAVAA